MRLKFLIAPLAFAAASLPGSALADEVKHFHKINDFYVGMSAEEFVAVAAEGKKYPAFNVNGHWRSSSPEAALAASNILKLDGVDAVALFPGGDASAKSWALLVESAVAAEHRKDPTELWAATIEKFGQPNRYIKNESGDNGFEIVAQWMFEQNSGLSAENCERHFSKLDEKQRNPDCGTFVQVQYLGGALMARYRTTIIKHGD